MKIKGDDCEAGMGRVTKGHQKDCACSWTDDPCKAYTYGFLLGQYVFLLSLEMSAETLPTKGDIYERLQHAKLLLNMLKDPEAPLV